VLVTGGLGGKGRGLTPKGNFLMARKKPRRGNSEPVFWGIHVETKEKTWKKTRVAYLPKGRV